MAIFNSKLLVITVWVVPTQLFLTWGATFSRNQLFFAQQQCSNASKSWGQRSHTLGHQLGNRTSDWKSTSIIIYWYNNEYHHSHWWWYSKHYSHVFTHQCSVTMTFQWLWNSVRSSKRLPVVDREPMGNMDTPSSLVPSEPLDMSCQSNWKTTVLVSVIVVNQISRKRFEMQAIRGALWSAWIIPGSTVLSITFRTS